ncbi:hypothetical protein P154DRAFT_523517 [Amniculicola lignicola CBS 123094]|uniref:Heterokaryon incompatibility domain-containing protein n=1 Tax=Amniculicola lignicola CBS 123094 TaxID=1392246 RepID=A0A6A5WBR9_9PLEO|nr:hypothetical protein P154DRAFT_523517 [Amniculicola lignicola CBS 123094]
MSTIRLGPAFERHNPVYHPPIDNRSIRLLRFLPDGRGNFRGVLQTFPLGRAPDFYSASYVWGQRVSSHVISVSDGYVPVLASVAPLLKAICESNEYTSEDWWWIDSICINLDDVTERAAQVGIMGDVYSRTKRVALWLGEEREGASNCMGAVPFLLQLAGLKASLAGNKDMQGHLRTERFRPYWTAVGQLLARRWWTRVWTLQEFILPPEAKFYCGEQGIAWSKMKSALYSIYLITAGHDNMLFPRRHFDAAWNRRRMLQLWNDGRGEGLPLVATLAYVGDHQATDARDRTYSILGLVRERDRKVIGVPDYESKVPRSFARLVHEFWKEYKSLDIVCFSHLFNGYAVNLILEEGQKEMVPTWAPHWRADIQSSPVPLMASQSASSHIGNFRPLNAREHTAVYDAPGPRLRRKANVKFAENLKEMWCDAVLLDEIASLGGLDDCETRCNSVVCKSEGHQPFHRSAFPHQARPKKKKSDLAILESLARSLVLDREDKYLRFRAPQHYISDFLVLCQACLSLPPPDPGPSYKRQQPPRPSIDPLFTEWWHQNKTLRLTTQPLASLITSITTSPEATFSTLPPPASASTDAYTELPADDSSTFLERFYDTVRKKSRRLMVTEGGIVGMAPCRARPGDMVGIVLGCGIPLVLRRVGSREAWQVVGEAYAHGWMSGEVEGEVVQGRREVVRLRMV